MTIGIKAKTSIAFSVAVVSIAAGCVRLSRDSLTVSGGTPVVYQCENGERAVARYFSLSDDSLDFVKVTMPDGKEYTLPHVVSASGARFTDDFQLVWWTKGNTAFVEERDQEGKWQIKYSDCSIVSEE